MVVASVEILTRGGPMLPLKAYLAAFVRGGFIYTVEGVGLLLGLVNGNVVSGRIVQLSAVAIRRSFRPLRFDCLGILSWRFEERGDVVGALSRARVS